MHQSYSHPTHCVLSCVLRLFCLLASWAHIFFCSHCLFHLRPRPKRAWYVAVVSTFYISNEILSKVIGHCEP
jgi:hypothetical protein